MPSIRSASASNGGVGVFSDEGSGPNLGFASLWNSRVSNSSRFAACLPISRTVVSSPYCSGIAHRGDVLSEKVVWRMLRPYAAAAGVPGIAPHDARRSCAKLSTFFGRLLAHR